jgi:hypothetical protein
VAPLEIDRLLKGPEKQHRVMVVGPRYASRRLASAPPLRPGLHAIFFLTTPPREGFDLLSASERNAAFHIVTSRDIQPPDAVAGKSPVFRKRRCPMARRTPYEAPQ